ncbi:hypothetical protein MMC07_006309 [Pseudocyphellaria aurata]|nr:hypothetical protein [Pseudocyphellaria aurata]
MPTDRVLTVQRIYNARSSVYDSSWHPALAADYITWICPLPGQNVLDLACGTGLVSLMAKRSVGSTGSVTGIDVSDKMMDIAKQKSETQGLDVDFIHHDITDLEPLKGSTIRDDYDIITCTTALVLLEDPGKTIKQWTGLLKPGGRLITDVPTEDCQPVGLILEDMGRDLEIQLPFYRRWIKDIGSLQEVMIDAGLEIESARTTRDYVPMTEISGDTGELLFDKIFPEEVEGGEQDGKYKGMASFVEGFGAPGIRERAKSLFVEKLKKAAGTDGALKVYERLYVVTGRKPLSGNP